MKCPNEPKKEEATFHTEIAFLFIILVRLRNLQTNRVTKDKGQFLVVLDQVIKQSCNKSQL
jgi:hypothetical protein